MQYLISSLQQASSALILSGFLISRIKAVVGLSAMISFVVYGIPNAILPLPARQLMRVTG